MLPAPMISVATATAFLRPNFSFTSNVRIPISKNENSEENTANNTATKKNEPMILQPGNSAKIPDITMNNNLGPAVSSMPAP